MIPLARPVQPPAPSFESEQVREFVPHEPAPIAPARAAPGYAPAEPVKIEWPSDLQQVESDPDKVSAAERAPAEAPAAPRPRRLRKPAPSAGSEEPLEQIETGRS